MDDLPNRTLAVILIAAIIVSFGGTLVGMTRLTMITGAKAPKVFVPLINAMASATATVNLSIVELSSANWTPRGLNWSQGMVDGGKPGCTIDSAGNTGEFFVGADVNNCTGDPFEGEGGAVSSGLNLTNQGNTNLSVNISFDKTPADFIGGSGVVAKWNASDAWGVGTTGEDVCSVARPASYTSFATTATIVCNATDKLRNTPGNSTLRFDFVFVIPSNAPSGSKSAVITATYAKETAAFN